MKKIHLCSIICGLAALSLISSVNVSATDSTVNAVLMNTEYQTAQDQDFTTTIYVPENSNISSFEAVLNYDSNCVSFVKAEPHSDGENTVIVNEKNGKINLVFSGIENQTERIDVVDLTFHVDSDLAAGKYNVFSLDTKGTNNASSETSSGTATDHKLTSEFSGMSIYEYGDADLNGKVQARDVTHVKQYVVRMRDFSDTEKIYSNAYVDFEEDGVTPKVNSRDAGIIQQKVAKMDVTLGNRANVTFYDLDGKVFARKSVKLNSGLSYVPDVPDIVGVDELSWSLDPEKYVEADLSKITSDTEVYLIGEKNPMREKFENVVNVLETGFAEEGKYIVDDFQLPYKSNYGSFNMLSSADYKGLDIVWGINSGVLAQSVNISKDYVVDVPAGNDQVPYTTWVDFNANIYFDGIKYGEHTFHREIKGIIDMPSPAALKEVVDIPKELPEHYRLPGYISLESERLNYGVTTIQNVDIQWSVVKNSDGSTADKRVLDTTNNEIIYLKDETYVTLQYDFVFDGNVIYSDRISRTIPAKSIEGQVEYANEYIKSFVPSVISGETYFPTTVPLYDLTVSWIPDIESGKVEIGSNETVNGTVYKIIDVGEKAGYMEWAKVYANIERNGDTNFKRTGLEFDVQLAGNSSEITKDKIPDVALYNALLEIFDKRYGDKDGRLTEEEIYDTKVLEKLGYELDLSNKGIKCLSGIKYLKYLKKIDLSGNDLSGANASLGELASLNYLEQLSLSNCEISEIPSSVFSSKFLIEGIDLSYNNLRDVNFLTLTDSRTQVEQQFTELKELFLQGNYITDISNLSFVNDSGELVSRIPNVTVLTLSRDLDYYEYETGSKTGKTILKNIEDYEYDITTSMDISSLGLLENVTTLWLANNYISDISPLSNCKLLSTLDLSGNNITSTASSDGLAPISKLQSLTCLKLDNNDIHTVKSLRRLIYLEILSLSNNKIGNTSGILDGLSSLTYLDLDNNELSSFDAGSFGNLQRLYLENQGYYTAEDGIEFINTLEQVINLSEAKELVELRLNNNNIDSISVQSISNLKKLEYLSLSENTVVDLSFLQDLVYLTHLELARCKIRQSNEISGKDLSTGETTTEIVNNIAYLGNLTELLVLDLSGNNEIEDISALSTLTKLNVLYINDVELESAMSVRSMTKLKYLSMQNSGLKDFSFLNTLNQLEFLNLAGHKFDAFDFRNLRNYDNIVGLFLDSADSTEAININSFTNKQNLKYLSLANMDIGSVDVLPDMDNITYLGLRNTNISNFNGTYTESDGYIYPITRFNTIKYLDVAENPDLFTKENLEMLYDYVGSLTPEISILLYRDNAPEGYVPGLMNSKVEAKRIKNDVDFGVGGTDITAALNAGYSLQNTLNGYDVTWDVSENDSYYIKDGKLYFKNADKIDATTNISLNMNINGLYYRPEKNNSSPFTPVSFGASIKTSTKQVKTGTEFVKRDQTTSNSDSLDGWILDSSKTELGYSNYSDWSGWSKTPVSGNDLRYVETKKVPEYTDWGAWSGWSRSVIVRSDLRDVEEHSIQDPYYEYVDHYYPQCSSSFASLVDALKSVGIDSSYSNRSQIAEKNGISGYRGTSSQNIALLNMLKDGTLYDYTETITKYNDVKEYRYRERSKIEVTYYHYKERTKVPTVYHFYRDVYKDVFKDEISGMTLVVEK